MPVLVPEVCISLFAILRIKESLNKAVCGTFNVHNLEFLRLEHNHSYLEVLSWLRRYVPFFHYSRSL